MGDAAIVLLAYWVVARKPGRRWILQPTRWQLAVFVAIGLGATLVIEKLALAGMWLGGWTYSMRMPLVPWIGVGLAPALQWILLRPLTVWFCKRQRAGARDR